MYAEFKGKNKNYTISYCCGVLRISHGDNDIMLDGAEPSWVYKLTEAIGEALKDEFVGWRTGVHEEYRDYEEGIPF